MNSVRVVVADNHPTRLRELRRALLGEGLVCDSGDAVAYENLAARLAEVEPALVLIYCDGRQAGFAAIRTARSVTDVPVLACSSAIHANFEREALAAGCREMLSVEGLREELSAALETVEAEGGIPDQRGAMIAMFSPSGGAGVSTTASNLAVRMASEQKGQVALADLSAAPSDLSLMLDIEPRYTINDLCRVWDRLDRQMIEQAVLHHDSGIDVLVQPGCPDQGGLLEQNLSRQAVRQLITLLRRMYAVTVLDLDHRLSEETVEAMRLSTSVMLVARPDVPGLLRARWALDTAVRSGVPRERFRLILNRFDKGGRISVAQAEAMMGVKVAQSIPDDVASARQAVNEGVPLVKMSKSSPVSKSYLSLAQCVLG